LTTAIEKRYSGAKCSCGKPIAWVRRTQFAGDHPFCEDCAKLELDFGKDDPGGSSFFWQRLDSPAEPETKRDVVAVAGDIADLLAAWMRARKPYNVKNELAAALLTTLRDERNNERVAVSNAHTLLEILGKTLRRAEAERDVLRKTLLRTEEIVCGVIGRPTTVAEANQQLKQLIRDTRAQIAALDIKESP
jgi:hypothetical protein